MQKLLHINVGVCQAFRVIRDAKTPLLIDAHDIKPFAPVFSELGKQTPVIIFFLIIFLIPIPVVLQHCYSIITALLEYCWSLITALLQYYHSIVTV